VKHDDTLKYHTDHRHKDCGFCDGESGFPIEMSLRTQSKLPPYRDTYRQTDTMTVFRISAVTSSLVERLSTFFILSRDRFTTLRLCRLYYYGLSPEVSLGPKSPVAVIAQLQRRLQGATVVLTCTVLELEKSRSCPLRTCCRLILPEMAQPATEIDLVAGAEFSI
jgi:hypothetical protein